MDTQLYTTHICLQCMCNNQIIENRKRKNNNFPKMKKKLKHQDQGEQNGRFC